MKPFNKIRLSYLDDLEKEYTPPISHDFYIAPPEGVLETENWAMVNSLGGFENILVDKTTTRFDTEDKVGSLWYSPSLDLAVYPVDSRQEGSDLELILTWLFNNWSNVKQGQRIYLKEILDEAI